MKKLLAFAISAAMVFTMAGSVFAEPAGNTWADYQQYLIDTAGSNAPDLQEFTDQVMAIGSWDELDQSVSPWDQMFTTIGLSTWEEFEQGIVKEAAVPAGENMGGGSDDAASEGGESEDGESAEEEAAPAEGESDGDSAVEEVEYPVYDIDYSSYSSEEPYTVYKVKMTMQAGYQEINDYPNGGVMTIHAGIGYMDPFGEGYYYAGIMYPESFTAPEATYVSDWMDANYGCSLFCIYHTEVGDIYAWDGIYGANARDLSNFMTEGGEPYYTEEEVNGSMPIRGDALINIVTGGTGMFKGAYGILIGCTSGGGVYDTQNGMTLPQTLFKYMDGYVVVPDDCETTTLVEVTQELSEDTSALEVCNDNYAMVPMTLRMQAGALEEENEANSGIGTLLPYNGLALSVSYNGEEAANYNVSDYVNDNFLAVFGEPEFMTFHINDGVVAGDVYAYKFTYATILDTSSVLSLTGTQSAIYILMVDGTGDFEGVTGMLGGYDVTSDYEGWGLEGVEFMNDLPLSHQTWAEGYMKVPAESPAALYGNNIICDEYNAYVTEELTSLGSAVAEEEAIAEGESEGGESEGGESEGDASSAPEIPEGLEPGEEPPGGFGGID